MPRAMISSLIRNYSFTSRYYNIPTNLSRVALWETSFLLHQILIGSLSKGVFERRTSTESEVFSLLTCLDDIKFVFLSFFTVIEAIWLKICAKPPSKNQKRPLPVDVRRSETLLLKLPIIRENHEKPLEEGLTIFTSKSSTNRAKCFIRYMF